MNLLVEVAECSVGMLRTGFGLVNIDDMCLRPFRARTGTLTQPTFLPNLKHDEI